MNTSPAGVFHEMVEERIREWIDGLPRSGLYDPMAYLMELPAKRVRPVVLLMACEMSGGDARSALDAAVGVELFHNFTLMHDDIMDRAPLRRGRETVHVKWDVNTAILSGDAMLVKAYSLIAGHPQVLPMFNEHALAVCEGQQSDMEFEQRQNVSLEDYMDMIRRKTAMLLSCALRMGAVLGGAGVEDVERLAQAGVHLGLAFQLRDDLLDAFGDPGKVGKATGGDLRAGKKTWLLIRGMELEKYSGSLSEELSRPPDRRDIPRMLTTLEKLGVRKAAGELVEQHEQMAMVALASVSVPEIRKRPLKDLAGLLMARTW